MIIKNMDEPVPPTPPVPPIPPVPCCSLKNKLICSSAGLVVLIIVGVAAFAFGRNSAKPSSVSQTLPIPTSTSVTPTSDPTANWQTFQSADLTFEYPADWTKSGDFALIATEPKIRLVVIPKGNTLMNECMEETSVETKGTLTIKKFSRVATGAMCETADATPWEIWVIPSPDAYSPGISYEYLSTQATQAESLFDQILSTFQFLQ